MYSTHAAGFRLNKNYRAAPSLKPNYLIVLYGCDNILNKNSTMNTAKNPY